MSQQLPNPGSDAALRQGCTCPVLDNGHGQGAWGGVRVNGQLQFWINGNCPLHATGKQSLSQSVASQES